MSLKERLEEFKRRSLRIKLLSAAALVLAVLIGLIIFLSILEYSFWFSSYTRAALFYLGLLITSALLIRFLVPHLLVALGLKSAPNDEETAKSISKRLPELNDQLINYLQLEKETENELARASLNQKSHFLDTYNFINAIDTSGLKRYSRLFGGVISLLFLITLLNPPLITSGTQRIIQHNKTFERPAPFRFVIENTSLEFFKNENFELVVRLDGADIPEAVTLHSQAGAITMTQKSAGVFAYTFQNPFESVDFYLEASGFTSQSYQLSMLSKPILNLLTINLVYPSHTGRLPEKLTNGGNISAPLGTQANWALQAAHAEQVLVYFADDTLEAKRLDEQTFEISRRLYESGSYEIVLFNDVARNEELLTYRVNVVPDEAPEIQVDFLADTTAYKYVVITGKITDDYGFHSLDLYVEINEKILKRPILINTKQKNQGFYAEWFADSLSLKPEDNLTLYAIVRDNDAYGGFKAAKSAVFFFKKPSMKSLSDEIDEKAGGLEKRLDESLKEMSDLQKTLEEMSKKLKSQNDIGWQDEKLLEESLEQRKELEKMLQELKEKHDDLLKASDNFKQSESLKEKSEQLNNLLEDLMDESTRQLYEELQKLLQEKSSKENIKNTLNQINRQENRMMKDLERTKELFKRLQMESGLERLAQQLDSLSKQQLDLSKHGLDSSAIAEQQKIQENFEEMTKDLQAIEELNQELSRPEPLEDFDSDEKQIKQEMQKAAEEMNAGEKEKAKKNQQNASERMQKMSQKMQKMQAGMEAEAMQENIDNLRKIMDDLIRLSYRQEDLLKSFRTVNASDPRFVTLSQDQLKLKEDLVVIEDSLLALAGRVVQISSFITKEIDEINMHMSASVEQIRERQQGRALSHQQFSMTSMNNLALLLDDVLQNMQMSMSEASGKGKGKPKPMPMPSLSDMQQQLGEQMQKLQNEGKSGRELSEELARMAAEQEMIRQQLQDMQNKLNGQFGNENISDKMSQAIKMMEQNELDLVNKRLTQQLMQRQKEITTRLLEAEKAMKEQQQDPEREGEAAQQRERLFPPGFEEYLNERKKEIELLRSVPIDLKPFYKKEVNDYFRRLSENN
jgi:hypothetical protein